jgi:hypothetical protein
MPYTVWEGNKECDGFDIDERERMKTGEKREIRAEKRRGIRNQSREGRVEMPDVSPH